MGTAKVVDAILAQEGAIKSCFPPKIKGPGRVLEATIVFTWPKDDPRTLTVDASETSPQAKAMTACVRAKLEAAPIPAANGQDDIGGQPARAKFLASYD